MIVPDVNLLVYAHNRSDPRFHNAKTWWEGLLNGDELVGIPWVSTMGFLRLITHPNILEHPMPVPEAVDRVREWLERRQVMVLEPGPRFPLLFLKYLEEVGVGGNLTTDTYLAAITVEHQAVLHSHDTDFHRFSGLKWRDPLAN